MSSSIKLGNIFGIPVGIHYSWFIIFVLVTLSLAMVFFPQGYPGWSEATYWTIGIVGSLVFFGSVLAHELAHSLLSRRFGVPVKSITLFLFGGVSSITRDVDKPGQELLMAGAGPFTSIVLGGIFIGISFLTRGVSTPVAALSIYLGYINILLGVFNLVPGFPLDGGRVFRSIVWAITGNYSRATKIATGVGQGFAYLLILGGVYLVLRGDWANGIWIALIGWFMENAASSAYQQVRLRESLQGYTAADLMRGECARVPGNLSLTSLVNDHLLTGGQRCFMVTEGDRLEGLVTLHEIRGVPRENWDTTSISDAMTKAAALQAVPPEEDAYAVLERMDSQDVNQIPVVKDGRLLGIVARDSVLRFIRTKSDLGV